MGHQSPYYQPEKSYQPVEMKYKVSPTKILIAGALQMVTTTIGFILYKRPYVWALSALEWYDEVYCGTLLDSAKSKYESLPEKYKAQVRTKIQVTTAECNEDYLDSFTDKVTSELDCLRYQLECARLLSCPDS